MGWHIVPLYVCSNWKKVDSCSHLMVGGLGTGRTCRLLSSIFPDELLQALSAWYTHQIPFGWIIHIWKRPFQCFASIWFSWFYQYHSTGQRAERSQSDVLFGAPKPLGGVKAAKWGESKINRGKVPGILCSAAYPTEQPCLPHQWAATCSSRPQLEHSLTFKSFAPVPSIPLSTNRTQGRMFFSQIHCQPFS